MVFVGLATRLCVLSGLSEIPCSVIYTSAMPSLSFLQSLAHAGLDMGGCGRMSKPLMLS